MHQHRRLGARSNCAQIVVHTHQRRRLGARSNCAQNVCLSPWSSGNPVHLRITRVGQATCHQCAEIRRAAEGSFSSPHSTTVFSRRLNKQKRPVFPISVILTESLPPPPPPTLGSFVWYAHTRGLRTPRQCAVRGQAGGWWDPGGLAMAVGVARPLPWWAAAGSRAGCLRGPAPVRPALLAACMDKDVSRGL